MKNSWWVWILFVLLILFGVLNYLLAHYVMGYLSFFLPIIYLQTTILGTIILFRIENLRDESKTKDRKDDKND